MRVTCTILLLLLATAAVCQPKTKPKEKAPTQKEWDANMKDMKGMMEEMMKDMSPEDKKMMDSMGITMPDMQKLKMPAVSDKQLAAAWEDEQRIVPKKDAGRIASIPTVGAARLAAYVTATHQKVTAGLDKKVVAVGNTVYGEIQKMAKHKREAGNMALGYWVSGQPELTLYLLGKICAEDVSVTDNLSNYTSALIMLGGEHLAIPILQNLNTQFRKNSTILNNLGQAWLGLGDISKAEKYLDSAIAISPYHPQAHATKATIEESKGNTAKAVAHLQKSMQHSYTKEKEDKLKKLGHKMERKDLRIPFKTTADPMGLEQMRRPDYPTSVAKLKALYPTWNDFNTQCDNKAKSLEIEYEDASAKYAKSVGKLASNALAIINSGGLPTYSTRPLMRKASMAITERLAYYEQKFKKLADKYLALNNDLDAIRKNNPPAPEDAPCEVNRARLDKLLEELNTRKKIFDDEALHLFRLYCNDIVYWAQYTSTDANMFKMIQLQYQIFWLHKNREYQPLDMSTYYGAYENCTEKEQAMPGKLSEFDDVACNYRATVDLIVVKYEMNCSHTIITHYGTYQDIIEKEVGNKYVGGSIKTHASVKASDNLGPVSIEGSLGIDIDQTLDADRNVTDWKGTVKAGVEASVGITEGPAELGAKVSEEAEMEFGPNGVEEVIITHSAEATAGLHNQSVTISTQERISLISGQASRTYSGALKGALFERF